MVTPAKAGVQTNMDIENGQSVWMPAFAGMTGKQERA